MSGWKGASWLLAGLLALAVGAPRVALSQDGPVRSEIPIREVKLSDGVRRYGIPMTIGGTEVVAGIDTGAAGLRVMPDAIPRTAAKAGAAAEFYNFGSGTRLDGVAGRADIRIGALGGSSTLHLVTKAGCIASKPNCPGTLGLGYGFLGDGLPKEGFRVLLGANMGRTTIDNPLIAAGARRWIMELPRPGDAAPGRLILNPTDDEVSGFTLLRLIGGFREEEGGGLHDSVQGCLANESGRARVCGVVALDTGAYSVRVLNSNLASDQWATGSLMTLSFTDETGKTVATRMSIGRESQALFNGTAPRRETIIETGVAPYYAFSVLYDPVRRMLGFKARPPVDGLPAAN